MTRWLATCSRLIIGALFVWAAATKLAELSRFGTEIANYQMLPGWLVPWFAVILPGVELAAGALCIVGLRARAAAAVLSTMLVVFIVALSQALIRGINLQCGCFGGADVATWGTVWRDVAMLVPGLIVLAFGPGRWALQPDPQPAVAEREPA